MTAAFAQPVSGTTATVQRAHHGAYQFRGTVRSHATVMSSAATSMHPQGPAPLETKIMSLLVVGEQSRGSSGHTQQGELLPLSTISQR